ncbi:MAG: hypothetical protein ACI87M_000481 [Yoonia sp.]
MGIILEDSVLKQRKQKKSGKKAGDRSKKESRTGRDLKMTVNRKRKIKLLETSRRQLLEKESQNQQIDVLKEKGVVNLRVILLNQNLPLDA